jgi:hypothetical protein
MARAGHGPRAMVMGTRYIQIQKILVTQVKPDNMGMVGRDARTPITFARSSSRKTASTSRRGLRVLRCRECGWSLWYHGNISGSDM